MIFPSTPATLAVLQSETFFIGFFAKIFPNSNSFFFLLFFFFSSPMNSVIAVPKPISNLDPEEEIERADCAGGEQ